MMMLIVMRITSTMMSIGMAMMLMTALMTTTMSFESVYAPGILGDKRMSLCIHWRHDRRLRRQPVRELGGVVWRTGTVGMHRDGLALWISSAHALGGE